MNENVRVPKGMHADPLKCGECGSDKFTIFNVKFPQAVRAGGGVGTRVGVRAEGDSGWSVVENSIAVLCENGHQSNIGFSLPRLAIDGMLCGGWRSDGD